MIIMMMMIIIIIMMTRAPANAAESQLKSKSCGIIGFVCTKILCAPRFYVHQAPTAVHQILCAIQQIDDDDCTK